MPEPQLDARLARRRFERAAPTYADASRLEAEIGERMLERLDYVRLAPRAVLDAGSGPLREARRLARRFPRARVLAVDVSAAMLRAGRPRFALFGRRGPLAACADAARLPLAADSVDLVWSNMALHWFADPAGALREFHRVLAVGGLLMLSTLGPDSLEVLRRAAGPGRVHAFADMHDVGDLLVATGFAEPVMDMERVTLLYRGGAALVADLRASGQTFARPGGPAGAARGLRGRAFRKRLVDALDAQARDGELAAAYEVVFGHAWKAAPRRAADGRAIVRFENRR